MKNKYLYGFIPILVLAVFATVVLAVLMSGAKTYATISKRDDKAFTNRTAAQYITVKVQQSQMQKDIRVEAFDGVTALVLPEKYGNEEYLTRLYCYEGYLYELFSPSDINMKPQDGEKILSLSKLNAEIMDGILTVELTGSDNEAVALKLYLKSKEEGKYEE